MSEHDWPEEKDGSERTPEEQGTSPEPEGWPAGRDPLTGEDSDGQSSNTIPAG
jgi:hypothetical protein